MAKPARAARGRAAPTKVDAAAFTARLNALQSDEELRKIRRYFKAEAGDYGAGDVFMAYAWAPCSRSPMNSSRWRRTRSRR